MSNVWREVSPTLRSSTTPRITDVVDGLTTREKRRNGLMWVEKSRENAQIWNSGVVHEISSKYDVGHDDDDDMSWSVDVDMTPEQRALRYYSDPAEQDHFLNATPLDALMDHQEEAVTFLARCGPNAQPPGCLFCYAPRMGKTLSIYTEGLRDLQSRVRDGEPRFGEPMLFVGPKGSLHTLYGQLTKHFGDASTCPLIAIVIRNPTAMRAWTRQSLMACCDIVITSYSVLTACRDCPVPYSIQWRKMVCDEAHTFSNAKTEVFDAVMAINARSRVFMTGTPIQNSLTDLETALTFIGMDLTKTPMPPVESEEFAALMNHVFLRKTPDDVDIDIPHAVADEIQDHLMPFGEESERTYYQYLFAQTRKQRAAESKQNMISNRTLLNILRLRQVCVSWPISLNTSGSQLPSGIRAPSVKKDGKEKIRRYLQHALMVVEDMGMMDVKQYSLGANVLPPVVTKERGVIRYVVNKIIAAGDKGIIFSHWVEPLKRLRALFRTRAKMLGSSDETGGVLLITGKDGLDERTRIIARAREDPRIHCLLITIETGGQSHDLAFANHVLLLDPWYNPADEDQAMDRVGGLEQRKEIHVVRFMIRGTVVCLFPLLLLDATDIFHLGTVDEHLVNICDRKRKMAQAVFNAKKQTTTATVNDSGAKMLVEMLMMSEL